MDIKSELTQTNYEAVTGILNQALFKKVMLSIEILKRNEVTHQFRTTVLPKIHSETIMDKLKLELTGNTYVLQKLRTEFEVLEK